ncbi:MAG: FGGY-family carbohydrate kinase, partial [Actinobacteria bacterium]|nr:FGGY-family carbohydrate kinase [Actinomycetota bacterium]
MDLLATGAAFRWLAGVLGIADESTLLDLAAGAGSDVPVFLPYVAPGEQGALWEPDLTGTLHGLHVGHGAAEIARALVTGIVLESRRCLATLADHGFDRGLIRVSGGSASNPWFRQQLADATGRAVVTSGGAETDRSAAGAAEVAASAIGRHRGPSASDQDACFPVPETAQTWQTAMER